MRAKASVNDLDRNMSNEEMRSYIEQAVNAEKKRFIDEAIGAGQKIFDSEKVKAAAELQEIWKDIDVEYQREFNLPSLLEKMDTELIIKDIEQEQSLYKEAGIALGRVFDSGRSLLSRFDNLLLAVGTAAFGVVGDLLNMATGQQTKSDWRDKIRKDIERVYGSLDKNMTRVLNEEYSQRANDMCRSVQISVNARIDEMEHQLKEIIREKESREQDIVKQREYLMNKQEQLNKITKDLGVI